MASRGFFLGYNGGRRVFSGCNGGGRVFLGVWWQQEKSLGMVAAEKKRGMLITERILMDVMSKWNVVCCQQRKYFDMLLTETVEVRWQQGRLQVCCQREFMVPAVNREPSCNCQQGKFQGVLSAREF